MLTDDACAARLLDQMPPCDPSAPPREVRVRLNSDLLRIVDELGMDLSAHCEQGLAEQVRRAVYARWRWEQCGIPRDAGQ